MGDGSSIRSTGEQSISSSDLAARDWTVVTGTLPGNLTMVTVAHWEDGRIAEKYLFLQSPAPMMNQTGAGQ
jgi:hypothetical protein